MGGNTAIIRTNSNFVHVGTGFSSEYMICSTNINEIKRGFEFYFKPFNFLTTKV